MAVEAKQRILRALIAAASPDAAEQVRAICSADVTYAAVHSEPLHVPPQLCRSVSVYVSEVSASGIIKTLRV